MRYPNDLTDAEWAILEPMFPPPAKTGRKRGWPMREVVNAIFFVLRGGCRWRMLPEHFPPHQTTYAWFVPGDNYPERRSLTVIVALQSATFSA